MAPAILGAAVGYIGATLVPAAWHHAAHWRLMSETLNGHGIWPSRMRTAGQAAAVVAQAILGAGCLYVALFPPRPDLPLAWWLLGGSLVLGVAFLGYVGLLRRRGVTGSCGCYYLGPANHASSASYVPSIGLTVAAGTGFAALIASQSTPATASVSALGAVILFSLAAALSVLVQCLALSGDTAADEAERAPVARAAATS